VAAVAACRRPERLPAGFDGEVRAGDLDNADYRRQVVKGVDVVCHAASAASMWGHAREERERFLAPAVDLVDQAVEAGVGRFILAGTVAMSAPPERGVLLDDRAETRPTGFWPHLDRLIDLDRHMAERAGEGTQMVLLRLGHFVGVGNAVGLVPALVPRLRTRLVPWLDRGRRRLPLVADTDLGAAFALAATATGLADYESFHIIGPERPTLREVVDHIAATAGCPRPWVSVPQRLGYVAGGLMEKLPPVLPGRSPFLTRSIVYLCEDWYCTNDRANQALGYAPRKDWRLAVDEQLRGLAADGYPWPRLSQF
jgi:nucleoside-diphosphate-sugar epimerase